MIFICPPFSAVISVCIIDFTISQYPVSDCDIRCIFDIMFLNGVGAVEITDEKHRN